MALHEPFIKIAEETPLVLSCKGHADSEASPQELTWRTPEGIHGPLQLAVEVKAIHCINLCLQALHLVHQGVHVGIRLSHGDADLQRGQVSPSQQLQTCCQSTPIVLYINDCAQE